MYNYDISSFNYSLSESEKMKGDDALREARHDSVLKSIDKRLSDLKEACVQSTREVERLCASPHPDLDLIMDAIDEHDLNERRIDQVRFLKSSMFPEA